MRPDYCPDLRDNKISLISCPLDEEPDYRKLLTEEKALLDRLAELGLDKWRQSGVLLLTDPAMCRKIVLDNGQDISDLGGPGRTWDTVLLQMGVPAYYVTVDRAEENSIMALDGITAWIPEDNEMNDILSKGVLLDANAAAVLIRRGFGDLIGIENTGIIKHMTSAEVFQDGTLEGMPGRRMPLRLGKERWHILKPSEEAVISTIFIDPQGAEYPGTVLFENRLGGRVATYAGCVDLGMEFYNHQRIRWMHALLEWLGSKKFSFIVDAPRRMLVIRKNFSGMTLLAFSSLGADCIDRLSGIIRGIGKIEELRRLDPSGTWTDADASFFTLAGDGEYRFNLPSKLQMYDWDIYIIRFS